MNDTLHRYRCAKCGKSEVGFKAPVGDCQWTLADQSTPLQATSGEMVDFVLDSIGSIDEVCAQELRQATADTETKQLEEYRRNS